MAVGRDSGDGGAGLALSPTQTWLLGGAVFVLAGVGTFVTQYLSGAYSSPDRTVGLVAGSALVGLASALPIVVLPLLPLVRGVLERVAANGRPVLALVVVILLVTGAILGLGPQVKRLTNEWWGCAPASEFTVVTTPAARNTADELLGAFEASTAQTNDGCPTAHGFVYDAPEQLITEAVAHNWAKTADAEPRRDIGPRPDIWLTESTLPVNALYDDSQTAALQSVHSFGLSPVVLAVPSGSASPTEGAALPELVASASASTGVVRPDPIRSTVGLLGTAALYGADVDKSPSRSDPAVADDLAVEQRMGAAASARAFPDGDEGALLCRLHELSDSNPALVLSEQAVRRFNARQLVGGPCPGNASPDRAEGGVRDDARAGPPGRAARLARGPRDATGSQGLRAVAQVVGRSTGRGVHRAASHQGRRQGVREPRRGGRHRSPRGRGRTPALPRGPPTRRELLALDFSGSMGRPDRPSSWTRAAVVQQAVADAACVVRPNDEIGLWAFPDDSDRRPQPVVPLTQDGCAAVAAAVQSLVPRGNTPLLQTLVNGVGALRATDDKAERRLVVVTDGEDTSSAVTRDEVMSRSPMHRSRSTS